MKAKATMTESDGRVRKRESLVREGRDAGKARYGSRGGLALGKKKAKERWATMGG